jgi:hypothetical protein
MLTALRAFENVINSQLTVVCGELNSEWKMDMKENPVSKDADVPHHPAESSQTRQPGKTIRMRKHVRPTEGIHVGSN